MLYKKIFILLFITHVIDAKIYKLINLTPHSRISVVAEIEGAGCKKQSTDHDIDQKEFVEINVPRKCQLKTIAIVPVLGDTNKPSLLSVDKLGDIETIAIKQSSHGYKLTYY